MHTTLQFLDLAKQRLALKHNLEMPMTDYRLAKLLGLRTQTISQWRNGRSRIGTEFVRKFAEACELPEAYVYACIEHERATPEVKVILEKIAQAFSKSAAAAILTAMFFIGSPQDSHAAAFSDGHPVYIMRSDRKRRREALLKRMREFLTWFPALPDGDALLSAI